MVCIGWICLLGCKECGAIAEYSTHLLVSSRTGQTRLRFASSVWQNTKIEYKWYSKTKAYPELGCEAGVYISHKWDRATPCLRELHCLTVDKRITFKVLMPVFKCLSMISPCYLSTSVSPYHPARASLRSASDTTILAVPNTIKLFKGTPIGHSAKVSLWCVTLLINTRFRYFYSRISNCCCC